MFILLYNFLIDSEREREAVRRRGTGRRERGGRGESKDHGDGGKEGVRARREGKGQASYITSQTYTTARILVLSTMFFTYGYTVVVTPQYPFYYSLFNIWYSAMYIASE